MPKGIPKNGTGGQFKKKDDARRNTAGQRSAAAVAFNSSLREIIATVGNEKVPQSQMTRVELMVRGLYVKAGKGDVSAFNALVERVEGKVPQQNEITGKDGKDFTVILKEIVKRDDANS